MGARFLRKPFALEGLAQALRAVLAAQGIGSQADRPRQSRVSLPVRPATSGVST